MSSTVILAAAAAFALGCVFCLGLWWLSTHRSKKGPHRDHEGHRLAVPVQWLRLGVVLLSAGLSGP